MDPVHDIALPGGAIVPAEMLRKFMWGGEERGLAWYRELPGLLATIAERWEITYLPELPVLSLNLVVFGHSAKAGPVVLKSAPPNEEVTAEISMVKAMQGLGYPDLIDYSTEQGWSLQQRVMPGTTLQAMWDAGEIDDETATDVFADMMVKERGEITDASRFHTMDRWTRDLFRYADLMHTHHNPLLVEAVQLAVALARDFLANPREQVLLHGDLQHNNILRSGDNDWMVIDPKGVVGDRAFEIGAWLFNPIGVNTHPDLQAMTNRRLNQLSARIGIERLHLWKWGLIACVLSDCWNLIDDPKNGEIFALPITRSLMALPEWEIVTQAS